MKGILLLLSLCCFDFSALAQSTAVKSDSITVAGPRFKFSEPDLYDFGDIKEGSLMVHDFIFKNVGTKPLIITGAMASCGCTTPQWPKEQILPGKTAKITIAYNSAGHSGEFIKNIFISSNAITEGESYVLHIKGNVLPRPVVKQ